ncbi:hypothetical protein F4859DRAFT_510507 [Xylaria cf. heliscus]|nr:hypothetical protein F4859DRAFT_510507 [Xylaria cf. heliscus]
MSTPHTTTRRGSTATEVTLTDTASIATEKMGDYKAKRGSFDDDEKTLYGLALNENSSSPSKAKLSKAMTQLKSKLKITDGKPSQKTSIKPGYYPDNMAKTFEAIAAARI